MTTPEAKLEPEPSAPTSRDLVLEAAREAAAQNEGYPHIVRMIRMGKADHDLLVKTGVAAINKYIARAGEPPAPIPPKDMTLIDQLEADAAYLEARDTLIFDVTAARIRKAVQMLRAPKGGA